MGCHYYYNAILWRAGKWTLTEWRYTNLPYILSAEVRVLANSMFECRQFGEPHKPKIKPNTCCIKTLFSSLDHLQATKCINSVRVKIRHSPYNTIYQLQCRILKYGKTLFGRLLHPVATLLLKLIWCFVSLLSILVATTLEPPRSSGSKQVLLLLK